VIVELLVISYIRNRYMDTPFLAAAFQVVVGGVLVFFDGDIDRECLRDLQFAIGAEQNRRLKEMVPIADFSRPVIQTRTGCRVRRANVRTATPTSASEPGSGTCCEKTTLSTEIARSPA